MISLTTAALVSLRKHQSTYSIACFKPLTIETPLSVTLVQYPICKCSNCFNPGTVDQLLRTKIRKVRTRYVKQCQIANIDAIQKQRFEISQAQTKKVSRNQLCEGVPFRDSTPASVMSVRDSSKDVRPVRSIISQYYITLLCTYVARMASLDR